MGGCSHGVDSPGTSTLCFLYGLEAPGNPHHGEITHLALVFKIEKILTFLNCNFICEIVTLERIIP